jgi:hypothetical protein
MVIVEPDVVYFPTLGAGSMLNDSLQVQLPDEPVVHEPDTPASAVPGFLKTESIVEHE